MNLNRTDNPDNATVGSPSTYVNTLSIASAENGTVMTNYFALSDDTKTFYIDSVEYLVEGKVAIVKRGELDFSEKVFNAENAGAVACIIWNHNDEDDIFTFSMTTAAEDTASISSASRSTMSPTPTRPTTSPASC